MRCQKDDDNLSNSQTSSISLARKWFKEYEATGNNFTLFQNLNYEWANAEIKDAKDGVQIIIVPIAEVNKNQNENWEQNLYIYKLNNNIYTALLYEFYPENQITANIDNFSGYISVWDLKKGFVRSAKFVNNSIVENGVVEVLTNEQLILKSFTNKQDKKNLDDEYGFGEGSGTPSPTALKEVVIENNYKDSYAYIYIPRGVDTSGYNSVDYTSNYTGGGGDGSSNNASILESPPSCESFNFTSKKGANWQEALVKNVNFRIVLLTPPNHIQITQVISFPQAISFGMPVNYNKGNGDVTAGVAATVSARIPSISNG